MARGSKMVVNRAAVDVVRLAVGDGLLSVANRILDVAVVPDATPLGLGLIEGGGAIAWVDGKKIGESRTGGRTAVKKPRALKLPKDGIVAVAGYGFPARFVELGTVHAAPHPFLSPAVDQVAGEAPAIMAATVKPRIARARP